MDGILPQKPRERNRKPTIKQIKTLQYISAGSSVRAAQKKAGYKMSVYNAGGKFFKSRAVQNALRNVVSLMVDAGLDDAKMAKKIAEFVDATKIDHSHTEPDKQVPDYATQIQGVKIWQDLIEKQNNINPPKKREITLTEFITGEKDD